MIFYLLDFLLNNLCIYTFAIILFFVEKYKKKDMILLLFIDCFINGIPVIFFSIFCLNYLNKWIKLKFVNGLLLDCLLFLFNYIIFFFILFIFKNNNFNINELFCFYIGNFFINCLLFFLLKRSKGLNV